AVDFLAPEAYGRIGDWERVKPGWFEREYARWATPNKPMIWAEAGVSTWDASRMTNSPERLRYAAEFYRNFYRLLIDSASDGVFFWWYPGGFRVYENSDYGIIEPDGTDREVTKVIREYGPKFVDGPSLKSVNHWIAFDRDTHPDGIAGVYDEVKAQFWAAIENGKVPGLKTAGTGTDSCTSPNLAVGNTPVPEPDAAGKIAKPLKYLDGAFDLVEVQAADGNWTRVESGATLTVDPNRPVVARLTLTNLGESAWSDRGPCAVVVSAASSATPAEGAVQIALPRKVGHMESVTLDGVEIAAATHRRAEVALRLLAKGKGEFGERFRVTLKP
ncbi:MAG: hypothetical protein ACP5R5_07420, partial [Armatimonadota bacterium]